MTTPSQPAGTAGASVVLAQAAAAGRPPNPAEVYLVRLQSDNSRRAMRSSLNLVARLLTKGTCDCLGFPWWDLRYEHC